MSQIDQKLPDVSKALMNLAKLASEIKSAEPNEADALLIESLDDANILATRNTKRIEEGLKQSFAFLTDIKSKSLQERILLFRQKRRAPLIGLAAKVTFAIGPVTAFGVLVFASTLPTIAIMLAGGPKIETKPPDSELNSWIYAMLYSSTALFWCIGDIVSKFIPGVGRHLRPIRWSDLFDCFALVYLWSVFGFLTPMLGELLNPFTLAASLGGSSGLTFYAVARYLVILLAPMACLTTIVLAVQYRRKK